jgi:hypothetical protein
MTLPQRKSKLPQLGIPPDPSGAFFSAQQLTQSEYQEHLIFRREQLDAWTRVNAKAMRGQRITDRDVKAIEPAATLILQIDQSEFEAKLLINTDSVPRQEAESLIERLGEVFYSPLDRDGKILVYYTDTPYRYEWS